MSSGQHGRQRSPGRPPVTFGMIVLNGEPFLRPNLRALYPYAHQIVVVEGASPAAAGSARADGHSRDGTLETLRAFKQQEDPDDKLLVVTAEDEGYSDGFWPGEKDEQSRAYATRARGDYLWQVDVDEFYARAGMEAVLTRLSADPPVLGASFHMTTFWGALDIICNGWYLRRGADIYHRLFRWGSGYTYASHRPPTVLDDRDRDLRTGGVPSGVWLGAADTGALGVELLHYSLLLPRQVREKVDYYTRWSVNPEWFAEAPRWMADSYLTLRRPLRVHNVYRLPSWLEWYEGVHPPEIRSMMAALERPDGFGGGEELRHTADARRLLRSPWYRSARVAVKAADPVDRIVGERARSARRRLTAAAIGAYHEHAAAGTLSSVAVRYRRAVARRIGPLRERLAPGPLILAYHRVAAADHDPQAMCVSPERFNGHLEAVTTLGRACSLRELVQRAAVGALPRRGVAVTFDDGYADNLHVAEPLLRRIGVPATVFVSSGIVAGGSFWWDELAGLLLDGDVPSGVVHVSLPKAQAGEGGGSVLSFDLAPPTAAPAWDLRSAVDPTPRQAAYRRLAGICRSASAPVRDDILRQVREQVRPGSGSPALLSDDELLRLSRSSVVDVGSHGVTHTLLAALTPGQQRRELAESKRALEGLTGRGCDLLSYPFGASDDVPPAVRRAAHDAGYVAACANVRGTMHAGSDPYWLPRLLVRDWTPDEFGAHLECWLAGDLGGSW